LAPISSGGRCTLKLPAIINPSEQLPRMLSQQTFSKLQQPENRVLCSTNYNSRKLFLETVWYLLLGYWRETAENCIQLPLPGELEFSFSFANAKTTQCLPDFPGGPTSCHFEVPHEYKFPVSIGVVPNWESRFLTLQCREDVPPNEVQLLPMAAQTWQEQITNKSSDKVPPLKISSMNYGNPFVTTGNFISWLLDVIRVKYSTV
jgi:hypothetical protein